MKLLQKTLVLLIIGLTSCTSIVTQKISGPSDCKSNGWSWNNGKATAGTDSEDDYVFTFVTTIAGDFSFSGKRYSNRFTSDLIVSFDGKRAFYNDDESTTTFTTTTFTEVSIGHVDAGVTITFSGWNCEVKDIIIKGKATKDEPTTEPNVNPEKPDDF